MYSADFYADGRGVCDDQTLASAIELIVLFDSLISVFVSSIL
jgi:hypothetical protein